LLIIWFGIPAVPDEERRGLLGRLPVVIRDHVGVGLEEEPDVRVADSLAENLRADTGFQRAGGIRVAQIVEGDPGEPSGGGEAIESLSIVSGCGGRPSSKVNT
jgi:hypothetical protein